MVRNVQGSTGPRFLHRRRRIALFIVAALLLVVALVLSQLGTWLVVSDALEKADVIVVLSGPVPFRAIEGARLYTEGWAPEIWLAREAQPVRDRAMAELGITSLRSSHYNVQILGKLRVPESAVRVLPGEIRNTAEELELVARTLREQNKTTVILVSSKPHTRRVRTIWRRVVAAGNLSAIVRPSPRDPFSAKRWWRSTDDATRVVYETLALLNAWLGFPLQPS